MEPQLPHLAGTAGAASEQRAYGEREEACRAQEVVELLRLRCHSVRRVSHGRREVGACVYASVRGWGPRTPQRRGARRWGPLRWLCCRCGGLGPVVGSSLGGCTSSRPPHPAPAAAPKNAAQPQNGPLCRCQLHTLKAAAKAQPAQLMPRSTSSHPSRPISLTSKSFPGVMVCTVCSAWAAAVPACPSMPTAAPPSRVALPLRSLTRRRGKAQLLHF
jgi:hypothetical protein